MALMVDDSQEMLSEAVELFSSIGLPVGNLKAYETAESFRRDDLVSVRMSDSETLVFSDWWVVDASRKLNKLYAWLFIDESPAVHVGLQVGRNPKGEDESLPETTIGSVEVRKDFRGQGLAVRTVKLLEQFTGHVVHSSGHYSPEGFRSLAGKFPYTRHTLERDRLNKLSSVSRHEEIGVWFDSMNFVDCWDTLTLKSLL